MGQNFPSAGGAKHVCICGARGPVSAIGGLAFELNGADPPNRYDLNVDAGRNRPQHAGFRSIALPPSCHITRAPGAIVGGAALPVYMAKSAAAL